ncbi:unnamed protein product [Rotaria sp. Silwood2]|nr:unnamed protein product [Rotaria sp. Silwood2]CAF3101674.1 unnamed protein product [Rotaria sp. Silwood2]CAF4366482.1 unnamed protein product [Rotaria sp. Silwood2]CAF4424279.1 unnamed protein product [Rotaria sp. Silwood2]CAF4507048.1 unnamed protein product [Rotaria sp. Silwood2]
MKSSTKLYRFPLAYASYMHSASISEDYLILTDVPLHFNTFYAMWNIISCGAVTDMFKWNSETMPTYFRVISLDTGEQIAHIAGPVFFTFHHINSYQINDNKKKIIVDICAFDDPRIINELFLDKLRENIFPSGSHRYSYAHSLVPIQFELPRINPKFIGKPYRYTYAIRAPPGRLLDSLIKLDAQSKEQVGLWKEECKSPSEPIFVPRPDANYDQEDDGVVLLVVLDQQAKQSFLLVLDGITFKELARAHLPIYIPLSFHSNFY